jgi:sterol desaturase/sphingolipid hydroxylase (fatty acid hydroxylase superfamily)
MTERKGLIANLMAGDPLTLWLVGFVVFGIVAGVLTGFFKARKIQPRGFKLKTFRNEIVITLISIPLSGVLLGGLSWLLHRYDLISFNSAPATWWQILLEYALYFFLFDTWFYWWHRLMHNEPMYKWVHKVHHWSTSPNLMTTASVTPLESLINGGFVPLFTAAFTVHSETMALIAPTNIIMGYYVHLGYEFFPRWWNKSWLTKWFITSTFHDQHHRYFTVNFGGYTTIWDRICGTMRPKYDVEFTQVQENAARHAAKQKAEKDAARAGGLTGPEATA